MKIWQSHEKGDDKVIAYFNNTIYRINPKSNEVDQIIADCLESKPPTKNFTSIPLHYLREINLEDNKNYIALLFNQDSYEHLKVQNQEKRTEIFEYFKNNIPHSTFLTDKYSKFRLGKKPLIAMCVVLGVFLWTFYVSSGFESGNDYQVVGNSRSLASIVLGIASLGTKKVILLFGSLFAIALTSFILKTRKPKVIHKIIIKR